MAVTKRQSVQKIHLIAAARPNFMKIAPLFHALGHEHWCDPLIVHTGQHYDANMSGTFFDDLSLPEAHYNLGVGSGTHAEQTAGVMIAYEKLCAAKRPDWVVVVGDVNSTVACTLTAKKLHLPVAHLEAGLRSFDRSMPEEINRLVTDSIADLLWTPSPDADENLSREGVLPERVARVGNIMMDSFERMRSKIETARIANKLKLEPRLYGVVTIHRPVNVDHDTNLEVIVSGLEKTSENLPLVFPIHPRTRARLERSNLLSRLARAQNIKLIDPLGYIDFMSLLSDCSIAITDSGGIQEETTYLGIPCVTLRESTERPITVTEGTNALAKISEFSQTVNSALSRPREEAARPEFWDGQTAQRIVASLRKACAIAD